ncbi:putative methionine-R-sulfoxide reductase with GAF domain [Salibacterium salarium]|uniref:GAF domain-containing protein n=1 Tax=Salibacterium salarium TaxID=284579 RepID=UPI002788570D|nr:GAF domain-containing protein [Salibacterium salarium]MDQ0300816.1 putative methionine-R-sulfoxide reductase with GAF domain [Salibacterium salarium]
MSIATDLASIRIIGSINQNHSTSASISNAVHSLCNEVDYINWAGIYFYEEGDAVLQDYMTTEKHNTTMQSQLAFPIQQAEKEVGVLVVKSKQWIVFDVNDVPTLETVASEIGQLA